MKVISAVLKLFHAQAWMAGVNVTGTPESYKHA
jgi:hypothetical protein